VKLTRVSIRRPTLAFVFIATMLLAGFVALRQLVVQAQPAASLPTVEIQLTYTGAPASFVRDHIVRPLEDQIAGSPGIEHISSIVELGAANILVQYQLQTDLNADLAYTLQQLQSARAQLPQDLLPPMLSVVNPSQGSVATIAVHSKSMSVANLAQFANVQIMPSIEQLPGIADAHVVDLPLAAFEITVDPTLLAASNLTLTDLIDTISANNVRAPGGLIYGTRQETQIDVRGDLPTAETIGKLAIRVPAPAFATYQMPGAPATNGVAFAGSAMPAGGAPASAMSGAMGGSSSGGSSSGGMGSSGGMASAPQAAMGAATQPLSSGSSTATGGGTGTNLVSIGNRMQQSSTAGSSYGSGSTAINIPPRTASLQSTSGSPYGSQGIVSPGGGTTYGGTSSPSPSNAASIVAGSTASNLDPANETSTTALPDASGSSSGSGGGYGSSGPAVAGTGGASGSGISLPPGTVASPSAQVPTAISASGSGVSPAVAPAPMPQISSPMDSSPSLSLSPGVGALAPYGAGSPNREIRDYAHVELGSKPVRVETVLNGSPGVEMQMLKFASASEITVAKEIEDALPDIRQKFPKIDFHIDHIQATYSQAQVDGVEHTIVESLVLVALVMVLFLQSWRNAVVAIVAIPTSLAVTVVVMRILGLTLDVISLLAMSLVIGTLIDDSTVVLENIERHADMGEEPVDAALKGRSEIGTAAIVLTLVDVVVFLPIAFFPTVIGKQLAEFGIVVSVATLTSLFVSFVVTPSLAGRWALRSQWKPWAPLRWFNDRFEAVSRWYGEKLLPSAEKARWVWIGATVLLIAVSFALVPLGVIGQEYIPSGDRPDLYVQLFYPSGTSLARTAELTGPLDKKFNGYANAVSVETTYGAFDTPSNVPAQEGSAAQLHVYLKPGTSDNDAMSALRKMAHNALPHGTQVVVFPANSETGAATRSIEEQVTHKDDTDPSDDAARVAEVMRAVPGTVDVVDASSNKAPEVEVEFDRDMARALDVPVGAAASAVRAAFGGATASQITTENGLVQLDVIYPRSGQHSLDDIALVPLRTSAGQIVHVGDVAHLSFSKQPAVLTRQDRADAVLVSATLAPGYELSNVMRDFDARMAKLHLDSNAVVAPTSSSNTERMNETLKLVGTSLLGSVVLVYLLLVALYNSYRTPFVILLAIPPATIGALLSLALTHSTLNLYSLIGMLLLVGLVLKNSILLVDYANTLRREKGLDRREAIEASAKARFRPIVMTTVAMVLGLLPVALGLDPGAGSRRALGIVVIGGLLVSLLLTLVLVPLFYRWIAPKELKKRVLFADERGDDDIGPQGQPQLA